MTPANIYLVEDHPLLQRMLREVIARWPELQVCGGATTAHAALVQLPTLAIDLMLVDVSLPDRNGIELVELILRQRPALPCVMLSGHQEHSYVQQALVAGARGYIAKGNPLELRDAINQVLQGRLYVSPSLRKP